MMVYKLISKLVNDVVEIVVSLGKGEELKVNSKLNNGIKDVFVYLLILIQVDKNNIDSIIIVDGFYKKLDIY